MIVVPYHLIFKYIYLVFTASSFSSRLPSGQYDVSMAVVPFRLLLLALPALVASQSLVLIGGGLRDDDAPLWERMIELAVSISTNQLNRPNVALSLVS